MLGLDRDRLSPLADLLGVAGGPRAVLYAEPTYGRYGLTVNPPGISKWSGIEAYCRHARVAPEEVLAMGDADNDPTMLERAGIAVAVRGGTDGVVALADHVIGPPAEPGWIDVLELIG